MVNGNTQPTRALVKADLRRPGIQDRRLRLAVLKQSRHELLFLDEDEVRVRVRGLRLELVVVLVLHTITPFRHRFSCVLPRRPKTRSGLPWCSQKRQYEIGGA